jgi:IS30 family transposase
MIAQEDYLVIHKLHALGYTITQIARELGLDRKTVRAHLQRDRPPQYQREARPSKLDPYRTWIRTRLEAAPRRGPVEEPEGVLAVVARDLAELVQDAPLLFPGVVVQSIGHLNCSMKMSPRRDGPTL